MTRTNGQDQSAEYHREQERQRLGEGWKKSFLSSLLSEERGSAQPQLVGSEIFGQYGDKGMVMAGGHSLIPTMKLRLADPGPVIEIGGVDYEPATERKDYPANFPVGSGRKPTGLAEGYKSVCERWSLDALDIAKLLHLEEETGLCDLFLSGQVPPMTGDLKDRMALVIGISIGLGELFHDDKNAELQWLTSERSELGGVSPLEHMLKGDLLNVGDVVDLVDNARGLR